MNSHFKTRIAKMVNSPDTRAGRLFSLCIQLLILISLVSFSIETLPGLSPVAQSSLWWLEVITVVIFTVEYGLRLWTAENRRRFVFSFFGLVDLLAILPFYLSTGLDLRGVRAVRMMRLFRILKLARYNRAMRRFARAFALAREELVLFFAATILILYASAVGIYFFERDAQPVAFASVFHALWWSVETLTTVGYGDIMPVTVGGRVFTFLIVMCGLAVVGMPAGIMASALTRAAKEEEKSHNDSLQANKDVSFVAIIPQAQEQLDPAGQALRPGNSDERR
jgi:voltage-gated potassium channel